MVSCLASGRSGQIVEDAPLRKLSVPLSKEDRYALQGMKGSKNFVDGHHEIALSWRPGSLQLHDIRTQALSIDFIEKESLKGLQLRRQVCKRS